MIKSIVTRKFEGVKHFHYYLFCQLKGGRIEITMKREKKVLFVILVMIVLTVWTVPAFAALRWDYLMTMGGNLDFEDNNVVYVDVMSDADVNDVDKMTLKCELQQYKGGWKTIKTWTETRNSPEIMYTKEYMVEKDYSYRIRLTASAYKNSKLLEKVTEVYAEQFYQ